MGRMEPTLLAVGKNGILPAGRQERQGRKMLVETPLFHHSNTT